VWRLFPPSWIDVTPDEPGGTITIVGARQPKL
jgi:hypothetical protein